MNSTKLNAAETSPSYCRFPYSILRNLLLFNTGYIMLCGERVEGNGNDKVPPGWSDRIVGVKLWLQRITTSRGWLKHPTTTHE